MSQASKKVPSNPSNSTKSSSFAGEGAPQWNSRVLIIDDEKAIASSLEKMLVPEEISVIPLRRSSRSMAETSHGAAPGEAVAAATKASYEVTVVHTPKAALAAVEQALLAGRPFAMGFFDVMLNSEIDGIELVKQIFGMDPQMQAVFVTAYSDRSVDSINQYLNIENAFRWDYVNKPFTQGEISQKARNGVSLWNLRQQKTFLDERIAESQKWLMDAERAHTVAAVSRSFVHEFGNIMTQIMGNCELALLKQDPERMRSALEVIAKASETASQILGKFKNISSPAVSSGGSSESDFVPKIQLLNISQVFDDALELMKFQFKKNQIQFEKNQFEIQLLEGDKNSLFQVFMNLLINAVHSMPEGGLIEVSLYKEANFVVCQIRDHGQGIAPENLDKIFEPNFTTKGDSGSGLGLSICKEIIEIGHQGELLIQNDPGGGVLAQVKIPQRLERI